MNADWEFCLPSWNYFLRNDRVPVSQAVCSSNLDKHFRFEAVECVQEREAAEELPHHSSDSISDSLACDDIWLDSSHEILKLYMWRALHTPQVPLNSNSAGIVKNNTNGLREGWRLIMKPGTENDYILLKDSWRNLSGSAHCRPTNSGKQQDGLCAERCNAWIPIKCWNLQIRAGENQRWDSEWLW